MLSAAQWLFLLWASDAVAQEHAPPRLDILHISDLHAHFEETLPSGAPCPPDDSSKCVGGLARVATAMKSVKEYILSSESAAEIHFLNAGNNFGGTLWFSAYGWNVTASLLNRVNWTTITLGNHEFDRKVESAVQFIKALNAPVVVCNIDDSKEPSFQGIYTKSIIRDFWRRHKIGFIGVITETTKYTSSPGGLQFKNVLATVREEGRLLKEQGVEYVVLLSHVGIEVDLEIANTDHYVDVIVGGHSHTLLHNAGDPYRQTFAEYPIIVKQPSGRNVVVVHAGSNGHYVGHLTVWFTNKGDVTSASGKTLYLDSNITPDPEMLEAMKQRAEKLQEVANAYVGYSAVHLEQSNYVCRNGECNLGNLVADAMVYNMVGKGPTGTWTRAAIAITHAKGLRAPIAAGDITFNDLVTSLPSEYTIDYLELRGKHIKAALDRTVRIIGRPGPGTGSWKYIYLAFLQVSGLKVVYDLSHGAADTILSVDVLCHECEVPKFEPLEEEKWYPLVLSSYLAYGGGDITEFAEESRNFEKGDLDTDVLKKYFKDHSVVTTSRDGRLVFENDPGFEYMYDYAHLVERG